MVEANGLRDRITVLPGWSTRLTLPRPADLLVSEIIGSEPFAERVLEFTRDAVRRMLKPGARLIPRRLRVFGLLVSVPPEQLARSTVTMECAGRWQKWYGFDFTALYGEARRSPQLIAIPPHKAREWTALADPVLLADVDLAAISEVFVDTTTHVTTRCAGRLDGLLIYFEAHLTGRRILSTAPTEGDDQSCWTSPGWLLNEGLMLGAGERVTVTYRYGIGKGEREVRIERA
jgi:hypothetical protein